MQNPKVRFAFALLELDQQKLRTGVETTRFWPPKTPKISGSRPALAVKTLPRGTEFLDAETGG